MKSQALERRNRQRLKRSDRAPAGSLLASPGTPTNENELDITVVPHCERCQGLLYWTELREWDGSRGQDRHGALRCIICGNIIDPVIVGNRRRVRAIAEESARAHGRRWWRALIQRDLRVNDRVNDNDKVGVPKRRER
jgi:hypothetical protein